MLKFQTIPATSLVTSRSPPQAPLPTGAQLMYRVPSWRLRIAGATWPSHCRPGAYVCNATLYHLADRTTRAAAEFAPRTGVGFIHVPAATPDAVADHDPVRSDVPLVPLPTIVTAVKAVLSAWV